MKTDTSIDHFEEATNYVSREAMSMILDSLAGVFHNEGYSMEGNNDGSDVFWFARLLGRAFHDRDLDFLDEARKVELLRISEITLNCLPQLTQRIAARYIRVSKALRTMEKVATAQKNQAKKRR